MKCSHLFGEFCLEYFSGGFGEINSGKNPSHPQKFACSYTYVANNLKKISKISLPPLEKFLPTPMTTKLHRGKYDVCLAVVSKVLENAEVRPL